MTRHTLEVSDQIENCTSGRGCPGARSDHQATKVRLDEQPWCSFCIADAIGSGVLVLVDGEGIGATSQDADISGIEVAW